MDDFEKAASLATPPALNLAPKAMGITHPSPAGLSSLKSGSLTPRETSTPTAAHPLVPTRPSATTPMVSGGSLLSPSPIVSATAPATTAASGLQSVAAAAVGTAASVASPRLAAQQQGLQSRAVKPEIKGDPSLPRSTSAATSGLENTASAAATSRPSAEQLGGAIQLPGAVAAPVQGVSPSVAFSQAESPRAAAAAAQPAAAATDAYEAASRATPADQQTAELMEIDPFEGMASPAMDTSAAPAQSGLLNHGLSQHDSGLSQSASAARPAHEGVPTDIHDALPSTAAAAQVVESEAQQAIIPQQVSLQPSSSAVEQEPVDLYSDFGQEPSIQGTSQPVTVQPSTSRSSSLQRHVSGAPQPQVSTGASSLSQASLGQQQSPATSPELLRRSSSASQAQAGAAAGLSHRDPRRSSGARPTVGQPSKSLPGSAATRDPRQVAAAADAQSNMRAVQAPAAAAPVAPTGAAQVARQPAPGGQGGADLPRSTAIASAAPAVAKQTSTASAAPAVTGQPNPASLESAASRQAAGRLQAPKQTVGAAGAKPSLPADAPAATSGELYTVVHLEHCCMCNNTAWCRSRSMCKCLAGVKDVMQTCS